MGSGIPFANNWAYLETELSWLERLLLVAVSQQRKNLKSVTRVAKTSSDKATSDWWQGLVAIKSRAYDDAAPKKTNDRPFLGYQKTLDQRILLSRAKNIALGLPAMQTSLGLSLFEKKLVLMALAPEVQVRYGKLYHYLQLGTHCPTGALPTLELALRLLCRNDGERRRARANLSADNVLLQQRVLQPVEGATTFLGSQLQLAPHWVDYLLAEHPDPLWPMQQIMAGWGRRCRDRILWSDIVLPPELKQTLETLSTQGPSRLLLVGEKDVGKERVAIALSNYLKQPLHQIDVAAISPSDWPACLQELQQANYPMVLITSAHRWLAQASAIDSAALHHWLSHSSTHIVFTVAHRHLVRRHWRQQLTALDIPRADAQMRLQLWQQSFPGGVKGMGNVRWGYLAEALALSPQQITDIAQMTQALAQDAAATREQLQQVLAQQGYEWKGR